MTSQVRVIVAYLNEVEPCMFDLHVNILLRFILSGCDGFNSHLTDTDCLSPGRHNAK